MAVLASHIPQLSHHLTIDFESIFFFLWRMKYKMDASRLDLEESSRKRFCFISANFLWDPLCVEASAMIGVLLGTESICRPCRT